MKDIQRFWARIDASLAFAALILAPAISADAAELTFPSVDEELKSFIIGNIRSCDSEVGFVIAYESGIGYRWYKDESSLPLSSSFGLVRANSMLSSQPYGVRMTNGLVRCYVYGWERFGQADLETSGSDFYCSVCFDDSVCRIAFVTPQKEPLKKMFRPFMSRSSVASRELVGYDSIWNYEIRPGVKVIDKQKFLSAFSNCVYKISGGLFAVREDVARKIVKHDYRMGIEGAADCSRITTKPRFGDVVVLDGREISEIVYWLWNRKGKRDEYAGFVREHSELFEPIADVSEFKTELGKRLLDTRE